MEAFPISFAPDNWEDPWLLHKTQKEAISRWANNGMDGVLRREAEDPETTGRRLEAMTQEISQYNARHWIEEAILAHPNVPPLVAKKIIQDFQCTQEKVQAFFANPVAPLMLLEVPDFLSSLCQTTQIRMLFEENIPAVFVQQLAGFAAANATVRDAARQHIAFAGEAAPENWEAELRLYFQRTCARAKRQTHQRHTELAELDLAPLWAAGPNPAPPLRVQGPRVLREWFAYDYEPGSKEALRLARKIAPHISPFVLEHGLRKNAHASDLMALLDVPGSHTLRVQRAALRHPAVTGAVIRKIIAGKTKKIWGLCRDAVLHPLTPPDVITDFLQSDLPQIRRMARNHPNAPPNADALCKQAALTLHSLGNSFFAAFVVGLQANEVQMSETRFSWHFRLNAALRLPLHEIPGDPFNRTGRDFLTHLSHDGNRFVRAAARARLADPNTVFSWGAPAETPTDTVKP